MEQLHQAHLSMASALHAVLAAMSAAVSLRHGVDEMTVKADIARG